MIQSTRVKVAVDAMGGDYAPEEIVKGAILAARQNNVEIALVGSTCVLEKELAKHRFSGNGHIKLFEASEFIREDESPALAVRNKPGCSIAIATKLLKTGEAQALVSAGSSGAVAVSAMQHLGMLDGVERPTVGGHLGSFAPNVIVVDIGANADCKPHQFVTFAIIGSIMAKKFLNITDPTIALLSTGIEEGKGNELVRESYYLLKNSSLNFIGNIEGNDILSGKANVIICDGFVGNVLLKFYESIPDYALIWTKNKMKKYPLLGPAAGSLFSKLFPVTKMTRDGEDNGSGILWGVDGIVRLAHGNCQAPAIAHAITNAKNAVNADIIGCLKSELAIFNNGIK